MVDDHAHGFYLALKSPALHHRVDLATTITTIALRHGQGIHFDSHGADEAAPTFHVLDCLLAQALQGVAAPPATFSVTLPARWTRSTIDAEWAIDRGLRVRLVKGEFPAASRSDEVDPRVGFQVLANRLAGRVPELAIATHDVGLARATIAAARSSGSVMIELLHGFPLRGMIDVAEDMAVPLGFYVPYGPTLLSFALRHLIMNPGKLTRGNYFGALASADRQIERTIDLVQRRHATR
jgi:proline dehydrogenase